MVFCSRKATSMDSLYDSRSMASTISQSSANAREMDRQAVCWSKLKRDLHASLRTSLFIVGYVLIHIQKAANRYFLPASSSVLSS